ncbi:recombinase family protein, partial [Oscillibacter ruminantium]
MPQKKTKYLTAQYERLSREDGDRMESDSILNQQRLIEDYCARDPEFQTVGHYSDDGYTGTNFDRPAFQRMVTDIEDGRVNCVVVKDLSRFGRDYI